jgi:hypothetical protein
MSNDEKSSLIFEDTREDLFLSKKMGGGGAGSAAVVLGLAAVRRCLGGRCSDPRRSDRLPRLLLVSFVSYLALSLLRIVKAL